MQRTISKGKQQKSPCLLFFDIDGTILSETTGCVSENTKNAIRKAQENGHLVFINSGRSILCIEEAIKNIGFDGYICGCGTYIEYKGQVLLSQTIEQDLADEIIVDIKHCKLDALLEGSKGNYFGRNILAPEFIRTYNSQKHVHHFPIGRIDDPNVCFDKFCICNVRNSDFEKFYEKYQSRFHFIDRENDFYEIIPHGYSKATGIQFLMDYLNVPIQNTFGLGDSSNDLPMLQFVKNSIAMGNCSPSLKDIVSFVTKDVDKNGIEYALKHYQLI